MLNDFKSLFRGSILAHGTWEKSTGNMATVKGSPTDDDYKNHLDGKRGLGIIPVTTEGTCYYAAIDIDIDTIDHQELYDRINKRKIPLNVCRSKSGGAHLYVFFREPRPSGETQKLLRRWAALLGYPSKTEIFPKQTKSTEANFGNWLNLPYFCEKNTVRYGFGDTGSVSLEQFIKNVKYYTGKEQVDEKIGSDLIQIDQMPPCLKTLTQEGLMPGGRNVALFSFGVFYRKSSPNGWEDKLRQHNQNHVSPPLASREVEALIKSISDRQYQYKCNESPLCDFCDRKVCLTLPYGVGNKPWEDENNFDEIVVNNLRKITSDPPTYVLEINGKDLSLSSDEFRVFERLRRRVFEVQDAVIRPMKQAQWDQKLRALLATKTDIEAPADASEFGSVSSKIDDYLALSDRASKNGKGREQLLRGMPVVEDDKVLFQVNYLQKYLMSQKVMIDNSELFAILHRRDCTHSLFKVKGKTIRAWSIPLIQVNKQIENYSDEEFTRDEGEL